MLVPAAIRRLFIARVVDRYRALLANSPAPRRVLWECRVGMELLDRAVLSNGEAIGEVGLRGEEVETVHSERVLRRLVNHAHELVKIADPRESDRCVPRDRQLGVLGRKLLGPLAQRETRLLDRARDERGHRDHREKSEEADDADVDLTALAPEEDLRDERRQVRHDRDRPGEQGSRDAHPKDGREDRQHVVGEVARVDPAGQDEEDGRDDLGDRGADREAALAEPVVWENVEPKRREQEEQERARDEADPGGLVRRRQRGRTQQGGADAPARSLGRDAYPALVRGPRPRVTNHQFAAMVRQLGWPVAPSPGNRARN